MTHEYLPAHAFRIPFTSVIVEPVVSIHADREQALRLNPDLGLYLGLEERAAGGTWFDVRTGSDIMRRRFIDGENMDVVEIRREYLLRYLAARQKGLVVAHYHHRQLPRPSVAEISTFQPGELTFGSKRRGVKVLIQSAGPNTGLDSRRPSLLRRHHLWFMIRPPAVEPRELWLDEPPFNAHQFTFPTRGGDVAPARWRSFRGKDDGEFAGVICDFMTPVFFRQTVLERYQDSSTFAVDDNGSVYCGHFWSLSRSTRRTGNELVSSSIGDFAEGVPFDEWQHWQQYAVPPPTGEAIAAAMAEVPIPDAVNQLAEAMDELNAVFAVCCRRFGVAPPRIWNGSLDSLPCRQLKRVYRDDAGDDVFLQRATLASTFTIEGLDSSVMRSLLHAVGPNLHQTFDSPPRTLGSKNMLQRVTIMAALISQLRPALGELPVFLAALDGGQVASDAELQRELDAVRAHVRVLFAPIAFLYDLRTFAGVAHTPNPEQAGVAAEQLGLPRHGWHRTDYLALLRLVEESIRNVTRLLSDASNTIAELSTLSIPRGSAAALNR